MNKFLKLGGTNAAICSTANINTLPLSANLDVFRLAQSGPILECMTRRLFNWHYPEVTDFLKEHGFVFYKPHRGSHELWAKLNEDGTPERIVEVNRSHNAYPPKTLKRMIKQSGLSQDEWIKWASS